MKKIKIMLCLLCVMILTACRSEKTETKAELGKNQIYAYCVNNEKTELIEQVYEPDSNQGLTDNITDVITYLSKIQPTEEYQSPIPEGVEYIGNDTKKKHGRVEVSFSVVYDLVDADSLLFLKTCVVKTLLQMKGITSVTISLTDVVASDADHLTVSETFDQDSFTLSFGSESGYEQKGTIVLYFANASGDKLKEYRKSVEITNNSSLARIVVESLIAGPDGEDYTATIPENTTIRNISVKDGICYVDLSDEFYTIDNPLKNDIIVYSIVNSLVELPTVSKVQFLKNGEKQEFFRETMEFDGIFERNLDIIEEGK